MPDDAGASGWIVDACKEKSVNNTVDAEHSDVRRQSTRLNDLGCRLRASVRGKSGPVTERSCS